MVCPRCGLSYDNSLAACPSCGGSAGVSAPAGPRPKGWWECNWKWAVPLFTVALFVSFVATVVALVGVMFRSSYVYQEGLNRARASTNVIESIGEPIEAGLFVTGSINITGSSGQADLKIPISGPKGNGNLYARATKRAGEWRFSMLFFAPESGPRIDLLREQSLKEPQRF